MDVSRMLTLIGNYGFADYAQQDLVDAINEVYHDICGLEPWPFLEKDIELTFDGINDVATNSPADFRSVITMDDYVSGRRLIPIRIEEHREKHIDNMTLQSNPIYYYFINTTLKVYPIPSSSLATNDVHLLYLALEPDLTNASLSATLFLPARYHWAIIYGVLSMLYLEEDDESQSEFFQSRMDRKIARMRRDIWQRNFDMPDSIDVLDDDWDFYGGMTGGDYGATGP